MVMAGMPETMQWHKRVRRLVYMVPGDELWVLSERVSMKLWVWVQLACDLNIESPRNKMKPRHCQYRSPCRLWRWSEQYLNIQDNGPGRCEMGCLRVALIKRYLPTENRGVNSGANNSLQASPFKGGRVYSVQIEIIIRPFHADLICRCGLRSSVCCERCWRIY